MAIFDLDPLKLQTGLPRPNGGNFVKHSPTNMVFLYGLRSVTDVRADFVPQMLTLVTTSSPEAKITEAQWSVGYLLAGNLHKLPSQATVSELTM